MLNKGKNVNKIKIIIVALMVVLMTLGVYIKLTDKGANVIEIESIATDSLGHMKNEQLVLEAQKIDDNLYEIELPKSVNSKTVNQITNVILENKSNEGQESINVEVVDNKIQLTKEQIENYNVNLDVQYEIVVKHQEDGTTSILYDKTLKHEEAEKDSSVELKGKLPDTAELKVEQLSEERIKEIFGETKISVAYDIKIINDGTTEINPEDFGEICEVSINDANIATGSTVYHVKDDNTLEKANIIENTEGNISFEAQSFSVYGIGEDEIIPDEGIETGADVGDTTFRYSLSADGSTWSSWSSWITGSSSISYTTVYIPTGGSVKVKAYANGTGYCIGGSCNHYASNNAEQIIDTVWYTGTRLGKKVRNCRAH